MRRTLLICGVVALTGAVAGNVTATRSGPLPAPFASAAPPPAHVVASARRVETIDRPTAAVWRQLPSDLDRPPQRRWSNRSNRYSGPAWRNWRPRLPPSGASGFAWRRPFSERRYGGYAYREPPGWSGRYGRPPPRYHWRPERYAPDRHAYAGRDDRYGRRWVWTSPGDRYQR